MRLLECDEFKLLSRLAPMSENLNRGEQSIFVTVKDLQVWRPPGTTYSFRQPGRKEVICETGSRQLEAAGFTVALKAIYRPLYPILVDLSLL